MKHRKTVSLVIPFLFTRHSCCHCCCVLLLSMSMSVSWPYRFKSLSPDEVQYRREILNLRGYYAQCSALVVIFSIFIYGNTRRKDSTQQAVHARKISWWDSPPFRGRTETRKQYLITLLWLTWLLSLSVWETGDGMSMSDHSCYRFRLSRALSSRMLK